MKDLNNAGFDEPILDGISKIDDADIEEVSGGKKHPRIWVCPRCKYRNYMGEACESCGYVK